MPKRFLFPAKEERLSKAQKLMLKLGMLKVQGGK